MGDPPYNCPLITQIVNHCLLAGVNSQKIRLPLAKRAYPPLSLLEALPLELFLHVIGTLTDKELINLSLANKELGEKVTTYFVLREKKLLVKLFSLLKENYKGKEHILWKLQSFLDISKEMQCKSIGEARKEALKILRIAASTLADYPQDISLQELREQILRTNKQEAPVEIELFGSDSTTSVNVYSDVDVISLLTKFEDMVRLYCKRKCVSEDYDVSDVIFDLIQILDFEEAEQLLKKISSKANKIRPIRFIILAYIRVNHLDDAWRLFVDLPKGVHRKEVLESFVKYYFEKNQLGEALQASEKFTDRKYFHRMKKIILKKYESIPSHPAVISYLETNNFEEAERVARGIPAGNTRSKSIQLIVEKLCEAGHIARAEQLVLDMSDSDEIIRSIALHEIARTYLQAKRFEEAERIIRDIPLEEYSEGLLDRIIKHYIEVNYFKGAERFVKDVSWENDRYGCRYKAIRLIIDKYLAANRFDEAERLVRDISNKEMKSKMIIAIVDSYLKADRFDEAERVAKKIPDDWFRSKAMKSINKQRQTTASKA